MKKFENGWFIILIRTCIYFIINSIFFILNYIFIIFCFFDIIDKNGKLQVQVSHPDKPVSAC
ncbi:hypothetical protein, partial [Pseudolactococcus laudensis]|uniref:hypothetical protein n=1 Tax=Pseudolactococcus laudensis TaxID=1494461 RepID=UPI003F97D7FD